MALRKVPCGRAEEEGGGQEREGTTRGAGGERQGEGQGGQEGGGALRGGLLSRFGAHSEPFRGHIGSVSGLFEAVLSDSDL